MKKLFDNIFSKINFKNMFVSLLIIIIIGHLLNWNWSHKYFCFNQYFLVCMLIVQIIMLKTIKSENDKIKKLLSDTQEMEVYGSFIAKEKGVIHNTPNNIISTFLVVVYIFSMYQVGCLEYTLTGCFFGMIGALVFYIGIQTYLQYISLIYFAYDLKNLDIKKYFFYCPALTEWIEQLAHEFNVVEKWFLMLGTMYSIIYAVNLPKGTFVLKNSLSIQTSCNFLFYVTWIGIIVLFVLAIPSFIILSRHFIKECVYLCKRKSINAIKNQIKLLSYQSTENDLKMINMQIALINEISMSEKYPLKYNHTVFDNVYTIIFSITTLLSPLMSIIKQFIP